MKDRQILDQFQREATRFLGASFCEQFRPVSIRNGVLTVAVEKVAVAQEVQWKFPVLLERVNTHFHQPVLKRLQIIFQGRAEGMV